MKRFFYIISVSTILLFSLSSLFAQQNGNIDFVKLNDDLSIMEGILDKLVGSVVSSTWPPTSQSQGFYVPEYGLIFSVPISRSTSAPLLVFPPMSNVPNGSGLSLSYGRNIPNSTQMEEQEK